jgi:hypothetical protein
VVATFREIAVAVLDCRARKVEDRWARIPPVRRQCSKWDRRSEPRPGQAPEADFRPYRAHPPVESRTLLVNHHQDFVRHASVVNDCSSSIAVQTLLRTGFGTRWNSGTEIRGRLRAFPYPPGKAPCEMDGRGTRDGAPDSYCGRPKFSRGASVADDAIEVNRCEVCGINAELFYR